jgi:hypothetical protein
VLIRTAWDYWKSQLTLPTSDRAKASKHLKKLIKSDKDLDVERNQRLLKSLDLALMPSKVKPGSIEALIDDLVDFNADPGVVSLSERGPRYQRLVEKGFEAVPTLIEHLDDDRLTRSENKGLFTNFRVQHVVSDLIERLMGKESRLGSMREEKSYALAEDEAKKWWEQASKINEEQYALDHVLPSSKGEDDEESVNDHLLHLIERKYPKHLPKLYRTVLEEHPKTQGFDVAEAVRKSNLSKNEKMALFLYAVGRSNAEHRYVAILQIKELDKDRFRRLLVESKHA